MALQWGHCQMFFSCPEDRHTEIVDAVNDACEQVGRCSWWEEVEPASKSRYAQDGEQWHIQYDTDDYHDDSVYKLVQERIPDITFRYVEAGMSYD